MAHLQQAGEDASVSFCNWHPEVETRLSCSYCTKSICTDCLVQVPVGIRCRECAKTEKLPTFDVRPMHYTRGMAVALGVALGGGIIWVLFTNLFGQPFLSAAFALVVGFAAGELTSLAVNRKRSILLSWSTAAAVIIAFLIHLAAAGYMGGLWGLTFLVVGIYIAYIKLR